MQWVLLGLVVSAAVAYAGYARGALSLSGLIAAVVVGTLTFGLGGWDWGLLLIAFFVSSSLLSRYREQDKSALAEKFAKGYRRDWAQALANGGLGALLAIVSAAAGPSSFPLLLAAFVGTMATVNADTWATELGVLSRTRPRLITTGREAEVGSSGAISGLGIAATLTGGALVGVLAGAFQLVLGRTWQFSLLLLSAAVISGLVGSLVDSLLGATVQAQYYCDLCAKETERTLHRCGTSTRQLRGWRWLNNDWVNLLSSAAGAAVAVGMIASLA